MDDDESATIIRVSSKQVIGAMVWAIGALGSIIAGGVGVIYSNGVDSSKAAGLRFESFKHGDYKELTDRVTLLELETELLKDDSKECEGRHSELSARLSSHEQRSYGLHEKYSDAVSALAAENRAQDRSIADCIQRTR